MRGIARHRRAITQPAFSPRIRAFEHWLGQDIPDRSSNRVQIRSGLHESEPEIRALPQRLDELQRLIRFAGAAETTVTVTAQHALAQTMMCGCMNLVQQEAGPVNFRQRTADRSECISAFVRGDAELMLCYSAPDDPHLPFDESYARMHWGDEALIPVAGSAGALDQIPKDRPLISYPEQSYLGQLLARAERAGLVRPCEGRPICDTEFSAAA
ncbi:hypothetical protein [Leisingera thetidis]|uniref:hypothetical protein n=1 Tax=Leisingera thetidis TaxID=2930199 RepID=UPI0021F6B3BB|nr:hypothetical protein [Leisingera thetidis]